MNFLKIILVTIIIALSSNITIAQDELYKKYSGKEGVTKIYISKAMFSLLKGVDISTIASEASEAVNIGEIIESLTGLYILSSDSETVSNEMEKDFEILTKRSNLELLMEVEDDSDIVKMYIAKERDVIKNFFLKVEECNGSLTIMFFEGEISESQLSKIVNVAATI